MGNARKQLFFGREAYPSITCSICNSLEPNTWLDVLLNCKQSHIYALQIKRHNKVVWTLRKLIVSSKHSRCYILMNAGTFNDNPPEYMVSLWKLPCTCSLQRCHCNARFKPDIICVKDYHTKQILQIPLKITSKFNLLNLHTVMIDFH